MGKSVAFGVGVLLWAASGPVLAAASAEEARAVEARSAARPATPSKKLAEAQDQMKTIVGGVSRIRHLMPRAEGRPYRASCVAQKLTEAKIHVQLAEQEMAVLARPAGPGPGKDAAEAPRTAGEAAGDEAYALRRLELLARRTAEIERTARECVDDDLSGIQVTKVEVIEPGKEADTDPPRAILVSPNR